MAGAIDKMSRLTVSYTNEREQFGRPVSRFQAVQQHLVWASQDAALTRYGRRERWASGKPWRRPLRDRFSETRRQPGSNSRYQGMPPSPWRYGHDPGIRTASFEPTLVDLAVRVWRRTRMVELGGPSSSCARRRRAVPTNHCWVSSPLVYEPVIVVFGRNDSAGKPCRTRFTRESGPEQPPYLSLLSAPATPWVLLARSGSGKLGQR